MRIMPLIRRVRYWRHAPSRRQELLDEMSLHRDLLERDFLARGMPPAEARDAARRAMGNDTYMREEAGFTWVWPWLDGTWQDVRYALRGLRARPAFAAGICVTLALGIGANAAMFRIVDRVLLRPPAYLRDVDRVHRLYEGGMRNRHEVLDDGFSLARYLDLRRTTQSFETIVAYGAEHYAIGDGDATRLRPMVGASGDFFRLFDAKPALGRFFTAADDSLLTGSPVVVLGYDYWQTEFGGRRDVLGQTLRVGRTVCTIVGVAPEGFAGLDDGAVPDLYVPITTMAWDQRPLDYRKRYGWHWIELVAVRRPGVSVAVATADAGAAMRQSWVAQNAAEPTYAKALDQLRPRAVLGPIQHERGPLATADARVVMWVTGVAVIVLLIACANVANLLLARAASRRREIGLRVALGVGRGRLLRQLLTESLVLSAVGGAFGLVVAAVGERTIGALLFTTPDAGNLAADGRTLVATALMVAVVGLLTGLAPALHASRPDVISALSAGSRETDARSARLQTLLFVFQAALSVVLLVGAGLFVRSLRNVEHTAMGFDIDPVAVVTLNSRGVNMSTEQGKQFEDRIALAATSIPGVVSATPAPTIPYWAYEGRELYVDGAGRVDTTGSFVLQAGNAALFRTIGTPIVAGRGFDSGDRTDSRLVMVVSDAMARLLWPGQRAIGRCVRIDADTAPCREVIGIAANTRVRSLRAASQYEYYLPISQYADRTSMLLVRVAGNGAEYVETLRRALQREMPPPSYVTVTPFRDIVSPQMKSWHLGATMFVAFGGLALVLAAVGLYSLLAYGVVQRRHEIGIRMALGASPRQVVQVVVVTAMRMVVLGVVLGGSIAYIAARQASGLFFEESSGDPVVYAATLGTLLVTALAATLLPATTAARVDPNAALRG